MAADQPPTRVRRERTYERTRYLPDVQNLHIGESAHVEILEQAFSGNIAGVVVEQIFVDEERIEGRNVQLFHTYAENEPRLLAIY